MAIVSAQKLMLVLGATGFLGRFVVERMIANNYPIRVVTRGGADWRKSTISTLRHKGVDVIIGDITDDDVLDQAVDGCSALINMAGSFSETKDVSFEDLNVSTVERLIARCSKGGIQRFVQVSCVGAHNLSDCRYFRSKWEGEQAIRAGKFYWTIFRPSYMFGDEFPLLNYLRPMFTFKLFLPLIGSGTNKIQPIFVEDVADCIVQSVYDKNTVGKSYDLVGPDDYQMLELLEMVRRSLDIGGPTVNIPSQLSGRTFDILSKALPRSFLTNDLVGLMSDDACGKQAEMLENFKVKNVSLRQYLPQIVESLGFYA